MNTFLTDLPWICLVIILLAVAGPHYFAHFLANKLKRPHWAIAIYSWMIAINYTAGSAYINRGQAYILLKDYQQAMEDTKRGLALRPQSAVGYSNLSTIANRLRAYQQAVEAANRAIERNPLLLVAYQNRAFASIHLKDYQRALHDCETLLQMRPTHFHALRLEVVCYAYLGQYQRAIDEANYALTLKLDDANCYHNRGIAYLGLHQLAQAKADLLHSQEIEPEEPAHRLALEWYRLGFEQADKEMPMRLEALAACAMSEEQQQLPLLCQGIALWLQGAYEEGLLAFEQALLLAPQDEEVYFWIAMASAALGREREACDALDYARQLGLPCILLAPLKLLYTRQPAFFAQHAQPLLESFSLLS